MLPVTISLGLINVNLVINSLVGTLVSVEAPAAIDKAFRIYMLPQGMFSVALTTVIFPTLSRFAARQALRRPARDDGQRDAPDRAPAAPGDGGDPGALGADGRADLPARRVRRLADRARRGGALLVRLLAAVQRPLPAPDADLLQPPAALGADRDRGAQPRDHGGLRVRVLRALRRRRDRRRDGDRHRGQRRRPGRRPAPHARRPRDPEADLEHDPDRDRVGAARRGRVRDLVGLSTTRSAPRCGRRSPRSGRRSSSSGAVYLGALHVLRVPELEQILRVVRSREST